jgi:hypothetical protein
MRIERAFDGEIRRQSHPRPVDAEIAALAGRQEGVVAREQLIQIGLGAAAIDHRVKRGVLHVVHRGVYAVGHRRLSREGYWTAAVLAAGPGAVLSHRSAAALWGIRDTRRVRVEVTVDRHCRRPGIDAHRVALAADEVTTERGMPVTTPARTLLDLADVLDLLQLEWAVHETEYRRLASPLSLETLLARHLGRRGTAVLRGIVNRGNLGKTIPRSELERAFLAFLDEHGIPRPLVNQTIGPYTVDGLYRDQRLVIELDGRGAHQTTRAFEEDRRRDRDLVTSGYRVIRITYRQLHAEPATIAAQLRSLTAAAA